MASNLNRLVERNAAVSYDTTESRKGFFTDTSICIGCKACEVACKEWNRNPVDGDYELLGSSFDNTGSLGADTWRHVAFIEQDEDRIEKAKQSGRKLISLGMPTISTVDKQPEDLSNVDTTPPDTPDFRWLMSSDVCKHCTHAGCLDVCPTGALFRTEFGTVVVQDDVCNGCGTCVAGCPFGVIERRDDGGVSIQTDHDAAPHVNQQEPSQQREPSHLDMPEPTKGGIVGGLTTLGRRLFGDLRETAPDFTPGVQPPKKNVGVAQKCTLCYDRLKAGETPACAKACPTTSIKFGDHDDLLQQARERVRQLHAQGMTEARLYGANSADGVGGTGSIFLLLDEPEVYGLPPDPVVPTENMPNTWARAALGAAGMMGAAAAMFMLGGEK